MQKTAENYQDIFLNQARKDRTMLTVFLMNGFQMRGIITGFDQFVILLQSDGRQQMIYKHAVSTRRSRSPDAGLSSAPLPPGYLKEHYEARQILFYRYPLDPACRDRRVFRL